MSSSPDNPWLNQGAPTASNQPPESRRPLYFLVFAAGVLLLTLMAVFYIKVIRDGRDAADPDKDPKSTSEEAPQTPSSEKKTTLNGNGSLDEARTVVKDLKEKTSCEVESDAKNLTVFIQAANKEDKLSKERKFITSAMTALSKHCGAEYTLKLTNEMKSSTSEVSSLASDHSWWHLASPAPHDTKNVTEFTTGKQTIRCKFDDDGVSCSIYVYDYPSPDGCEGKTATYHLGQASDVTADCKSALNSSIQVSDGSNVSHNGIWCSVSQEQGITCTSELSGKGFQIKRASARIF